MPPGVELAGRGVDAGSAMQNGVLGETPVACAGDLAPVRSADHQLFRVLGLSTGVGIVVGNVIGSGIFVKPGIIASELGDFRLILLAWVLGGVLCLLGGLCVAELAAMLPQAGGLYVYLREAYGPLAAFLFGWNELFFNRPASTGALAVIFIGSFARIAGWEISNLAEVSLATGVIATVAWINVRGVAWGGNVQTGTMLVKAGFLALLAILPLFFWFGESRGSVANWASVRPITGSLSTQFGIVMLAVMWAYNGWHGIAPVAEEIRQPEKNIPRALLGGIGLLIALYLAANLAYHFVLPMDRLAASGEHAAEEMVRTMLGPAGSSAMALILMCSTFGAINGDLLMAPRISFAMGRDGVFFRRLAQVHPRFRTPSTAILVQASMAIALVLLSGVLVEFSPRFRTTSVFELLTNFVIFAASIFYVLAVMAVPVLRWKRPGLTRPYRTWGYPGAPLLFLLVYAWFLFEVYRSHPFEAQWGLVLIAAGVPVYFAYASWRQRRALAALASLPLSVSADDRAATVS